VSLDEFKRYATWMCTTMTDMSFSESGAGILVEGDKAAFEHRFSGIFEGQRVAWLALCACELAGGKIQRVRTV
jgi:hypothetical protein